VSEGMLVGKKFFVKWRGVFLSLLSVLTFPCPYHGMCILQNICFAVMC
jgi:hypothetical protein